MEGTDSPMRLGPGKDLKKLKAGKWLGNTQALKWENGSICSF